jgi:hypothetical protein
MPRTTIEIQTDITNVNAAITAVLTGNKLLELRVGSGDFARTYRWQELSLESLYAMRTSLYEELATVTIETPTFTLGKTVAMFTRR